MLPFTDIRPFDFRIDSLDSRAELFRPVNKSIRLLGCQTSPAKGHPVKRECECKVQIGVDQWSCRL